VEGGGNEEQQLDASIKHIDKAVVELDMVLGWLKDEKSSERTALHEKLDQLNHQLEKAAASLATAKIDAEEAEIRIAIADAKLKIANDQLRIAGLAREKSAIDLANAGRQEQKADLHKQAEDLKSKHTDYLLKKSYENVLERFANLRGAEAERVAATHAVRGQRAELTAADREFSRPVRTLPVADEVRRELMKACDREIEAASASVRELLRLLRWVDSSLPREYVLPADQIAQINVIRQVSEAIDKAWVGQNFRHEWIQEIDLDGRTEAGQEQIRQIFSPTGTILRIVPGSGSPPTSAGTVSLGPAGIIKKHDNHRNARIVAVIFLAAKKPANPKNLAYSVLSQGGWTRSFTWLGSMFEPTGDGLQSVSPPNRESIRSVITLDSAKEHYEPYNDDPRPSDWDRISALTPEGNALLRMGFLPSPSRPMGPNSHPTTAPLDSFAMTASSATETVYTRLSNSNFLKPAGDLNRIVLEWFRVQVGLGMGALPTSPDFQACLGPPLYGEHHLRIIPGEDLWNNSSGAPPVDHLRICILYLFNDK
jgi:hypothetical protein